MPERLESQGGRPPARSVPNAYVPLSSRRGARSVTWVYPPLPSAVEPPRSRPGGPNLGYRDLYPFEVPAGYGDTRIVAMPRDPNWLFAYWEIGGALADAVRREHGSRIFEESRKILRVHDVTELEFDGTNAHRCWDLEVGDTRSWYVHVGEPDRDYCVDLGLLTSDGRFILLARSNVVRTPAEGFSSVLDAEWLTLEEIYRLSVGLDRSESSAALVRAAAARLRELVSSPGISSLMSPFGGAAAGQRPFWLNVGAELVVYGSTEPDACLEAGGNQVSLRPDGSFTLRLAFPDGEFALPVLARSRHTGEEQGVTLTFRRETATR
ncbi:MAG: DUF4912 domain-containing protein [Chitinophagales bacterium]